LSTSLKPVYLLADSQLLFRNGPDDAFPGVIKQLVGKSDIRASYIGASNQDDLGFYEIFKGAMQRLDILHCSQIRSEFPSQDREALELSDIILLAGGETRLGWDIIRASGMSDILVHKYYAGAILLGISAGAIQLGMLACTGEECFSALQLVPFNIAVHDEESDWKSFKQLMIRESSQVAGVGIPLGAGMICHPDHSIEAINKPLFEIRIKDSQVSQNLIMPH